MLTVAAFLSAFAADLNQQIRLTDGEGTPIVGAHTVELRLQDDAAIGAPDAHCYTTGPLSVTLDDGYASVAMTGVPDSCWSVARHLATIVDGTELGPRRLVADVPRARRAPVAVEHFTSGSGAWSPLYTPGHSATPIPQLTRVFTTSRTGLVHSCYSLTCSLGGHRVFVALRLDGATNETGWFESDLSTGSYTIHACASWPSVGAATHTVHVEMHTLPTSSASCWRGKLDVDVYYTE